MRGSLKPSGIHWDARGDAQLEDGGGVFYV